MRLKSKINQNGFTIVELLIVIVVIGILAAITIVAYNGIQNRGKTAAGQSLANSVAKKAEAYNAVGSTGYPTTLANFNAVTESVLDDSASVSFSATLLTGTTARDGKTVRYVATSAGGNVYYWDYSKATPSETAVKVGP